MPSRIRIPREFQSGFLKLLNIDNKSMEELLSLLRPLPSTYNLEQLLSSLTANVKTLSQNDIRNIVTAVLSLERLRSDLDYSEAELVEEITKALENSQPDHALFDDEKRSVFKQRLSALLNINSISVLSKAVSLFLEQGHIFQEARIVTDIRSVFVSQPDTTPSAAFIVHRLRISFLEDKEPKDFYVALDIGDIQRLIETLERAKKKAESLKEVIERSNIHYLSSE